MPQLRQFYPFSTIRSGPVFSRFRKFGRLPFLPCANFDSSENCQSRAGTLFPDFVTGNFLWPGLIFGIFTFCLILWTKTTPCFAFARLSSLYSAFSPSVL